MEEQDIEVYFRRCGNRPPCAQSLAQYLKCSVPEVEREISEVLPLFSEKIEVSAAELVTMNDAKSLVIFDLRTKVDFETLHLPGSLRLQDTYPDQLRNILSSDKNKVFVCKHGINSVSAVLYFKSKKFTNLYSLEGGIESISGDTFKRF